MGNNILFEDLYAGCTKSCGELEVLSRPTVLKALSSSKELVLNPKGDPKVYDQFLNLNLDQSYLITNLWILFTDGIGFPAMADLLTQQICSDGLIDTIGVCSNFADRLISERCVPTSLTGYIPEFMKLDSPKTIKYLLEIFRFPKRFSPVGATALYKSSTDDFMAREDNHRNRQHLFNDHDRDRISAFADRFMSPVGNDETISSMSYTCIHRSDMTSIYKFSDGTASFVGETYLLRELRACVSDILSFTTARGRKVSLDASLFPWSDSELDEAALTGAIPPGATMDSCKNRVCKMIAAQVHSNRHFGDERCIPVALKGAVEKGRNRIYPYASQLGITVSAVRDDVVVVLPVPKTYKAARLIAPESISNAIRAYMIERWFRRIINMSDFKSSIITKLPMETSPEHDYANIQHKRAADYKHFATFDFSAASDQQFKDLLSEVYPEDIYALLSKGVARYLTTDRKSRNPRIFFQQMFGTMGNPETFRSMPVILGAACLLSIRLHNIWRDKRTKAVPEHNFSVFGDDVAIDIRVAETFISICDALGFSLNLAKSHWEVDDPYREACGREYWLGTDITSTYWPRRALQKDRTCEDMDNYEGQDKSFWSSILSLNNHIVDLLSTKFRENKTMARAASFLHAYIHEEWPNAQFTHPDAPWRVEGVLLGYQPTVPIVSLNSDDGVTGDYLANATTKDVPYLKALERYDDPRTRFVVTRVGETGSEVRPVKGVPGAKDVAICPCAAMTDLQIDLYTDAALYYTYLCDGPAQLGSSHYEDKYTIRRKLDRKTPIMGLVEAVI